MAYTTDYHGSSNITTGMSSGITGPADILASNWIKRIKENTQEYYKKWSDRFKCDKLEQYYLGRQWEPSGTNYEPYTINLVFSTIEVKLPTLLFDTPIFHLSPRPVSVEYDFEGAIQRALLREDVLNTFMSDYIQDVGEVLEQIVLDAFFRFGVCEVGYSADWIDNPHADMPILRSDSKPWIYKNNVIKQPKKLPLNEQIYIKRIYPDRFRISGLQVGPRLEQANWCGYWEYVRTEDLVANPNLKNTDKIKWAGNRSSDFVDEDYGPEVNSFLRSGDLVKVWKIWDNRKKRRYIFADPHSLTLADEPFERLSLIGLRFHKVSKGWLPLPPVFNWKSPQDEYNEAREQGRNHRKRFIRKFLYKGIEFEEEEVDKLVNGGDGTFVKCNNDTNNAVAPVQNADLGAASQQSLIVSKDDFNIISGTSADQRGQNDRTTATQANITSQQGAVRDSRARKKVGTFLESLGIEVLLCIEENISAPMWIKSAVPQSAIQGAYEEITQIWHQITVDDLREGENDGINFNVKVTPDSLSPLEQDKDSQAFILFLSLLEQHPELSMDPLLIEETAFRVGYKNLKVIKRMVQAVQMKLAQKMNQTMGGGSPNNSPGATQSQQTIQNALPPQLQQIVNNTRNQVTQGGLG